VLEELGATVTTIGSRPDGVNINLDQGALHPGCLQGAVRDSGATLGIALDGDADRVLLVDSSGSVVDGDEILAILVDARLRAGDAATTVVGTVMSNMGLEIALKNRGVRLVRASVGDRYVVEEMQRHAATLGAEPSGHVVMLDHHTTGDGLLAALAVCRIIDESGKTLAELRGVMSKFPQVLVNVRVDRPRELKRIRGLQETIGQVERRLEGRGRVLVRPSGTEPVVRVMVEGEDEGRVREYAAEIADAVVQGCASGSGKEQA
jgi:phosphoglucosamine mutase